MTIQVVTAAEYLPVSLADARRWCRIEADVTDHDAVLTLLIGAMAEYAENLTGRALVHRTLKLILPWWPSVCLPGYAGPGIELEQPPYSSLSGIVYLDQDGDEQTLAADQYTLHDWREPALIVPAREVSWPALDSALNAVQVTYVAGYAPVGSPADEAAHQAGQPPSVKVWMEARLATLFENREQLIAANQMEIPRHFADALLDHLVTAKRLMG